MNEIKGIKAFVFDLDMTLIDSSYSIHHCTNLLAKEFNLKEISREQIMKAIGLPIEDSWISFWGEYKEEWLTYYRKNYIEEENAKLRLFPSTIPTLKTLKEKGYKTAVVTNRKLPERPIIAVGLKEYLDVIVGTSEVTHPKPHPEPLLVACKKLGIEPSEIIYTGDTDIDIKTALAANIKGIGVTTGNFTAEQLKHTGAWKTIATTDEILKMIGK
ncbi:MAG: HAD-IA family hydrolase [Synergistaceae bacterium]